MLVSGGLDDAVGLQCQVGTLEGLVGNDPADFADGESLVITRQFVGCGTGVIHQALGQTRTGSAAQVGRGEQFPLSLRSESSPAAGMKMLVEPVRR